jgi:hypothetical protein
MPAHATNEGLFVASVNDLSSRPVYDAAAVLSAWWINARLLTQSFENTFARW